MQSNDNNMASHISSPFCQNFCDDTCRLMLGFLNSFDLHLLKLVSKDMNDICGQEREMTTYQRRAYMYSFATPETFEFMSNKYLLNVFDDNRYIFRNVVWDNNPVKCSSAEIVYSGGTNNQFPNFSMEIIKIHIDPDMNWSYPDISGIKYEKFFRNIPEDEMLRFLTPFQQIVDSYRFRNKTLFLYLLQKYKEIYHKFYDDDMFESIRCEPYKSILQKHQKLPSEILSSPLMH